MIEDGTLNAYFTSSCHGKSSHRGPAWFDHWLKRHDTGTLDALHLARGQKAGGLLIPGRYRMRCIMLMRSSRWRSE